MGKGIDTLSDDEIEAIRNYLDLDSETNRYKFKNIINNIENYNKAIKRVLSDGNFIKIKQVLDEFEKKDIEKFEALNRAIQLRESAEAQKEKQKRWRIFWEKLGEDYYPFTIYIMYMGVLGLAIFGKILTFLGIVNAYLSIIILLIILWTPFILMPDDFWKKFEWVKILGPV